MTTGTEPAHLETVSRETPGLLPTPSTGALPAADVDLLDDAKAKARSWSPSTRRVYVVGWKHFTSWCFENRCSGLPAAPADVGPLPGAPGGNRGQDVGHRTPLPGRDRRGPPTGRTRGHDPRGHWSRRP